MFGFFAGFEKSKYRTGKTTGFQSPWVKVQISVFNDLNLPNQLF
jgi:hypothetical protein